MSGSLMRILPLLNTAVFAAVFSSIVALALLILGDSFTSVTFSTNSCELKEPFSSVARIVKEM